VQERVVRFRITYEKLRKYRVVCAYFDISPQKQAEKIFDDFIKIQEENMKRLENDEGT